MGEFEKILLGGFLSYWDCETESRAVAKRRLYPYLAVMGLHYVLDYGET